MINRFNDIDYEFSNIDSKSYKLIFDWIYFRFSIVVSYFVSLLNHKINLLPTKPAKCRFIRLFLITKIEVDLVILNLNSIGFKFEQNLWFSIFINYLFLFYYFI